MTTHHLKKELRGLRSIGPSSSWQTAHRELLLQQISSQVSVPVSLTPTGRLQSRWTAIEVAFSTTVSMIAARGVTVALLAVALLLGSGGYLIAAADNSIPGDRLYNLKVAVEDARLAWTRNPKERVKLRVEFADRRLSELERLSRIPGSGSRLATLVTQFESSVTGASSAVSELSARSADDGLAAAKLVDDKVAGYQHSLAVTGALQNDEDVTRSVDKALVTVNRAGTEALRVIVNEVTGPQAEVAKKLDEKIKNAEETLKIADAKLLGGAKGSPQDKARDQSSAAKENLAVAKQKIIDGDYKAALNILEKVDDIVIQVSSSAADATLPEGQVKGENDNTLPTPAPPPSAPPADSTVTVTPAE